MNGDGLGSPPWGPADPVPDLNDTQAIPGLGPVPGPGAGAGSAGSDGAGPNPPDGDRGRHRRRPAR